MTIAEKDFTRPKWQRLLLNRFVVVLGMLILLTVSWNLWVVTHDHGIVAGRVIDASGAPVEGAEVKLCASEDFTLQQPLLLTDGK